MQLQTSHIPTVPALPGSPTLTNPDMILPYDAPSPDSSSSTRRRAQRIPSPPPFDKNDLSQGAGTDGGDEMKGAMRKLFRNGDRSKSQKAAAAQRMEARDADNGMNGSSVLASSPTLHDNYTSEARPSEGYWSGFDGGPVKERESPDEEPIDIKDVGPPIYGFPPLDNEKDGFSAPPDIEDDDPYSHAAMSIRAEQILANAKKRLTNMEGNLNRARSTLHNRPSSSMSSFSNRTPDPVSLYTIPPGNLSPSKHRQMNSPPSATNNKGHNRVFSETSIPSSLQTQGQGKDGDTPTARASSAMGSGSLNSPGEHNWFWTGLTRNTSHAQRHNYQLPALDEDGPATETFKASPTGLETRVEEEDEDEAELKFTPPEPNEPVRSPNFSLESSPSLGLTRARSTTQMRDLRDQMQDLKGKISSLKRRAREDSLRRRSMQSLRTPSPFTAAENWHGDDPTLRQGSPKAVNGTPSSLLDDKHRSQESDKSLEAKQESHSQASQIIDQKVDDPDSDLTPQAEHPPVDETGRNEESLQTPTKGFINKDSNVHLGNGHSSGTDETDQDAELNGEQDSLYGDQDYHDTSPSPVGERHEDRPDAFDYETFFLHSGTGVLARKGHSRNSSHSSMYSVETTKPTYTLMDDSREFSNDTDSSSAEATPKRATSRQKERGHLRSDSGESISTVATFATATEGKGSDGEGDEDEWILQRPMAGAWTNDQSAKRKISPRSLNYMPNGHARSDSSSSKRSAPSRKVPPVTNGAEDIPVPIPSVPAHHLDPTPMSPSANSLSVLSREAGQMSEGDKKIAEMLINSLSKVCARLKEDAEDNGRYEERAWRRRLDTARRVLDGEMNGEAF